MLSSQLFLMKDKFRQLNYPVIVSVLSKRKSFHNHIAFFVIYFISVIFLDNGQKLYAFATYKENKQ